MYNLSELSNVELRLELAEAEYERPNSLRATILKQDRIKQITAELLGRGAF